MKSWEFRGVFFNLRTHVMSQYWLHPVEAVTHRQNTAYQAPSGSWVEEQVCTTAKQISDEPSLGCLAHESSGFRAVWMKTLPPP